MKTKCSDRVKKVICWIKNDFSVKKDTSFPCQFQRSPLQPVDAESGKRTQKMTMQTCASGMGYVALNVNVSVVYRYAGVLVQQFKIVHSCIYMLKSSLCVCFYYA